MIRIAIDGPGGAGKSSLAKAVAKELSIIYVDTGALYRTIALHVLKENINPDDKEKVIDSLKTLNLELKFENGKQVILLDGNDVGDSIRTQEVSMVASRTSSIPEVRAYLLDTQRNLAKKNSLIMDGRDIGTVILPKAEVKIFLTASPEARARRRYEELKAKGKEVPYEQVYAEMVERDKNDSTREIAPCVPADDAIMLDNSDLTFEGTVSAVLKIVEKAKKKLNKSNRCYMRWRRFLTPFSKFYSRYEVHGVENVPKEGGYLVCFNHISAIDPVLTGCACPRQIKYVGKKELMKVPFIGTLLRKWGVVPIDRGGNDIGAIRKTIELLDNQELVGIYPQGHRFKGVDPRETPVKNGVGLICYRAKCDVIPCFVKVKNNKYRLFRKAHIYFGKPIKYDDLGFVNGGNEEYGKITQKIFNSCIDLGDTPEKVESEKN